MLFTVLRFGRKQPNPFFGEGVVGMIMLSNLTGVIIDYFPLRLR
jgi:hypothetical protein